MYLVEHTPLGFSYSKCSYYTIFVQNTDPISGLSEPSSDHDDTESELNNQDVIDVAISERLFVTGVLDELKVCFRYSYQVSLFVAFLLY